MKNLDEVQFPQARLDALIASAATFDRMNLRMDALTPNAFRHLQQLDPALAYMLATGQDIKRYRGHMDASESVFYARSLEFIRTGLYDVLFPELEGSKFVPIEPGVPVGAELYTYRGQRKIGRANLIKQYADDARRADISGVEASTPIRGMADSYAYTSQEIRAAMMAGIPIDVKKAMAARYAIALLADEITFYGSTEGGLTGLATLASTTSFTARNGSTGSKLWRTKTPDEMVQDLHGVVNNVVKTTLGIHRPSDMLMPLALYNMAATRRMGDGSNQTVLEFFLATSPYVKNVSPTYRLDASASNYWNGNAQPVDGVGGGALTTSRLIAYEKNAERVSLVLPIEFEQMMPFQRHFVTETACHGRIGGVISPFPASVSYCDGLSDNTDF